MQKLTEQIIDVAGKDKAIHYETVILPNIAMDFYGMLQKSQAGSAVSEEYMMEDNSMKIILSGIRDKKGKCRIINTKVIQN